MLVVRIHFAPKQSRAGCDSDILTVEAPPAHSLTLFANSSSHIGTHTSNTLTANKCRVFLAAQQQIIENLVVNKTSSLSSSSYSKKIYFTDVFDVLHFNFTQFKINFHCEVSRGANWKAPDEISIAKTNSIGKNNSAIHFALVFSFWFLVQIAPIENSFLWRRRYFVADRRIEFESKSVKYILVLQSKWEARRK